jgi:hypothetical protein
MCMGILWLAPTLLHFPSTVFRRWSGLSPTAHVERAHSDRARSGSKGYDPDYLRPIRLK